MPAVFREHTNFMHRGKEIGVKKTIREQLEMEDDLLLDFYELVNEIGLKVPGDFRSIESPKEREFVVTLDDYSWPPEHLIELTAIAQHHRVPTRFLDFTYNALVAAFFAVYEFLEEGSDGKGESVEADDGRFAIWAIDGDFMDSTWPRQYITSRLQRVSVSGFDNVFLQRQNGLFIYDTQASSNVSGKGYQPINEIIELEARWHIDQKKNKELVPAIVKLDVPRKEAKELLRQLEKQRVNRAYLMPTYDNVRQTIKDRHFVST
jgi:hypothetical protein